MGGVGWFTATWMVMVAATILPATWPAICEEQAAGSEPAIRSRLWLDRVATIEGYLGL